MKHIIRYIVLLLALVTAGVNHIWAITNDDIIVNVQPNNSAGTVTITGISGTTVAISAVPASGYSIDANHILVEKMVNPSSRTRSNGLADRLEVTDNGENSYSFTIPSGYDGAYVTATFYKEAAAGFTAITSLSEIASNLGGNYQLTGDVDASTLSSSLGEFTGTLDGGFHKIYNLSVPLFSSTSGSAVIRNVTFEDVNISIASGDAGAVTAEAKGDSRIYNCGILPTSTERDADGNITGFNGSSVSGSGNVGGFVGKLSGSARVVNCYSYANIMGGTTKGGIVGNNNEASTQANLKTMVMNCMFYGDIADGGVISPIYGGKEINNVKGGMNNYNYYRYRSPYSVNKKITVYNRALAMEEKFINRFERYRLLLNSNKKLAAKYVSTTDVTVAADDMAKWVLETADRQILNPQPYPVLKIQGKYPSIINYDGEHAPDSASVGRLNGGKLGSKTLTVTITTKTDKTIGGQSWPTATSSDVQTTSLTLIRTDKDTVRYNFNYDKVQLPYYNDVGTGNYTEKRVVTGWKITSITGGTSGEYTEADSWGGYNFADRNCTDKDLYTKSGRVFSQGAYWDVPNGVTAITIEPYWAIANYVSDETYDVVYNNGYTKQTFTPFGTQYSDNTTIDIYNDGSTDQQVYTSISGAISGFDNEDKTVYDQAVVLVGNVHQYDVPTNGDAPYTLMSIDMNHDNEPDYSYIFSHNNRQPISPIRYDFLNIVGITEAQMPNGASTLRNVSIFNLKGWFEITNTCLVNFTQFEYDNNSTSTNGATKSFAPLILLGGTFEQFVSTQKSKPIDDDGTKHTEYIHVGSNVWFAKFGTGTHSDGDKFTPHVPVSVTGGDYDEFYLSGTYQPTISNMKSDNAECYISGGRFGEMAGASLEAIRGDVRWDINWADINNFYGGGVNAVNPITGDIRVDMTNSYVNLYCGGPKFGDMTGGKKVTTNATDCHFETFFGAGFGGNSYNRVKYQDVENGVPATYQDNYSSDRGKYFDGASTWANSSKTAYGRKGKGVATDFDYEFFVWSTGSTGARFYVKFVTFSLATTHNVTSNLSRCRVTGNVYGGGSLGKVAGDVNTTLTDCEINGNVFGAGYSATLPKIEVRTTPAFKTDKEPQKNMDIGMFEPGEANTTEEYEWKQVTAMPANGASGIKTIEGKNYVYTDVDLTTLGTVTGNATITIQGSTTVGGSVYGGGEESGVGGDTEVKITGGTIGTTGKGGATYGNVFGGGKGKADDANAGLVKGNTNITISGTVDATKIIHNVYGGGAFGSVGTFTYDGTTGLPNGLTANTGTANITITGGTFGSDGKENGMIFGSSRGSEGDPTADTNIDKIAWVGNTNVIIGTTSAESNANPWIKGSVYGGGENGHNYQDGQVTVHSGTIGITDSNEDGGARYSTRGNVYGGGCGTDTFDRGEGDNKKTYYNFNAGIVLGNTKVDIDGGHIVHNVYGGGAMGSVGTFTFADDAYHAEHTDVPVGMPISCAANTGKCTINITRGLFGMTNATMTGHDNDGPDDFGHVFGAGRGYSKDPNVYPNIESCAFFNNTDLTIGGTALVCGSVYGGSESGHVLGNTNVTIAGGQIGLGEDQTAAYTEDDFAKSSIKGTAHWTYEDNGHPYDQYAKSDGNYEGIADDDGPSARGGLPVATDGHTFYGNVFGGGSGYYPYAAGKWLRSAGMVEGTATVNITGGHILNNVYGGCEMADILGAVTVTMTGGTVGVPRTKEEIEALPTSGNIYGAGMGDKRIFFNTSTNVASSTVNVSNGRVFGSVYGGGEDGHVLGNATTTISQPTGKTTKIGCDGTSGFDGNVFGGGQGSSTALTAGVVGGNVTLNVQGGDMSGSVYGGGRIASVGTHFSMVEIEDPNNPGSMIPNPDYGVVTDDDNHGNITINLKGGNIAQDVFGGCMGTTLNDQLGESRSVVIHLNEDVEDDAKGCVVEGSIFGCNNVNSSPRRTVKVHIHKTQNKSATRITNPAEGEKTAKVAGRYDVKAVYGGGNLAAYIPTLLPDDEVAKQELAVAEVIIDGCDRTSIQTVYGGGNAASTPATSVTVNGTYEIEELFGGGNGKDALPNGDANPGANVGYKDYHLVENDPAFATKEARVSGEAFAPYRYGTGEATVNIKGGKIHRVFGGSNTKGNVRKTALTLLEELQEGGTPVCPFNVDEAYGGGKSAPMDAEAQLHMACIPGLKEAYGGAEAADIAGGVTLNITNGTFNRVFGGNNISGTIRGAIKVNIEETGCKPIIIGELYGGGNQAGYSVYGYDSDGTIVESGTTQLYADPEVNVKSFTSIGDIYGGGYGETAVMVGNPKVTINESVGTPDTYPTTGDDYNEKGFKGKTITIDEGQENEHQVSLPSHEKNKIGAINNVFGGGNAAKVIGNTNVYIGTEDKVVFNTPTKKKVTTGEGENTTVTEEYTTEADRTHSVVGADIRGNVYGGGNEAEVTGRTNVVIGKEGRMTPSATVP